MEKQILYSTKDFDVIDKDGRIGIEPNDLIVAIMPFEKDQRGLPKTIGVIKEYNPLRRGNYSITLITGKAEGEDPDVLSTAIRELQEKGGYHITDITRWHYLGIMTLSKLVDQEIPCFAVDVTGIERIKSVEQAEEETEDRIKNVYMQSTVKEALNTDDSFIPTLFMKMFLYVFGFDLKTDSSAELELIKKKLDILYLNVSGVKSSSIKHDMQGDPYIEYLVDSMTDDIKAIPNKMYDVNIAVKIDEPITDINDEPGK